MDLAGLASFETTECWTQFLFTQLMREQPKGFAKISLQQLLDCDRQLFIQASHITMGKLAADSQGIKPLDEVFQKLKDTTEILQYLTPLPAQRAHDPPPHGDNRPSKVARTEKPTKGQGKGKGGSGAAGPKPQLPDGCVTHDEDKRPFASPTSLASASSRALQENVAQEDIISVTRRDAIGRSRTTCAATQTERMQKAFHSYRIHLFLCLWRFLRDEGPYLERLHRRVFQF